MSTDTSEILAILQEKGEDFAKRTVVEKKRLKDLDDAIEHITKETEKFRTKAKSFAIKCLNKNVPDGRTCYQRADGVNVGREAMQQTKKTLMMSENNLSKVYTHYINRPSLYPVQSRQLTKLSATGATCRDRCREPKTESRNRPHAQTENADGSITEKIRGAPIRDEGKY